MDNYMTILEDIIAAIKEFIAKLQEFIDGFNKTYDFEGTEA